MHGPLRVALGAARMDADAGPHDGQLVPVHDAHGRAARQRLPRRAQGASLQPAWLRSPALKLVGHRSGGVTGSPAPIVGDCYRRLMMKLVTDCQSSPIGDLAASTVAQSPNIRLQPPTMIF